MILPNHHNQMPASVQAMPDVGIVHTHTHTHTHTDVGGQQLRGRPQYWNPVMRPRLKPL